VTHVIIFDTNGNGESQNGCIEVSVEEFLKMTRLRMGALFVSDRPYW